jgi:hypothetical protein
MQLVVNSSLQVLVKKSLELLVLLVEKSSLLDQVLSVHQQGVVLVGGLVQSMPDAQLLLAQNSSHFLPEDSLFSLNPFLLDALSFEVTLLLGSWVTESLLVFKFLLSLLMESDQALHNVVVLNSELVLVLFLVFLLLRL